MDGRGRAFDNIFVERLWRSVKHEDVYLKGYASMGELLVGLAEYFVFYNGDTRPRSFSTARQNGGLLDDLLTIASRSALVGNGWPT